MKRKTKRLLKSSILPLFLLSCMAAMFALAAHFETDMSSERSALERRHVQTVETHGDLISLGIELGNTEYVRNYIQYANTGDRSYRRAAETSLLKMQETYSRIQAIETTNDEKDAVYEIGKVLQGFDERLSEVETSIQSSNPVQIDESLVRDENNRALEAVKFLAREVRQDYGAIHNSLGRILDVSISQQSVFWPAMILSITLLAVLLTLGIKTRRNLPEKMHVHAKARFYERKLARYYLLAVGIMAVFIVCGYSYIHISIAKNQQAAAVINMAGMQRMNAQKIAFESLRLIEAETPSAHERYAMRLDQAIRRMQTNHDYLTNNDSSMSKYMLPTERIRSIYFDAPYLADQRVNMFLDNARALKSTYTQMQTGNSGGQTNNIENYANVVEVDGLVSLLDMIVSEYQYAAEMAMGRFETLERFLALLALSVLLMEVVFIFRPMAKLVTRRMSIIEEARAKAEELNHLKSDFLATMSHEIRTPMNGILGMAELITGASASSQVKGYANTIITSGETLLDIINDILDFSKIEAGKMTLDIVPLNLVELVDDIGVLYNVRARDKAVELVVHYQPGTEQFIYADPVRLRQVLSNLISNAVKFTDEGSVVVTVRQKDPENQSEDKVDIVFEVQDTGTGISPDKVEKIFEKFSQADNSTTRYYGGTGLGLSICKNLVELMGGEIHVDSVPGEGSRFSVVVPFDRNRDCEISHSQPPDLQNLRVLVVDDLPVVQDLVCEQLSEAGMRCTAVGSGEKALEMMRDAYNHRDPYQIVVIDYLMPEMNGEMLVRAIGDVPGLDDACLVMLTAAGNPLADSAFVERGFSAYIAKPVQAQNLIDGLAITWRKYNQGYKNSLIHLDTRSFSRDQDRRQVVKYPGKRVLVVEDNLVNQIFIKEIIEEMGCEHVVTANGREAIAEVKRHDFDLILMDCLMPVMDGFEATQRIRTLQKRDKVKRPLPIVALTANAMKGDREKCIKNGMDDYLSKPVRKQELITMVERWVTGQANTPQEQHEPR